VYYRPYLTSIGGISNDVHFKQSPFRCQGKRIFLFLYNCKRIFLFLYNCTLHAVLLVTRLLCPGLLPRFVRQVEWTYFQLPVLSIHL